MADSRDLEMQARDKLGELRRARTEPLVVTWPGTSLTVALRRLTDSQTLECLAAVHKKFRELELPTNDPTTAEGFANELSVQILFRACVDHEDIDPAVRASRPPRPFFSTVDELRDEVESERRADLFNMYGEWVGGTELSSLSPDLHQAILDLVKKKDARNLRLLGSCSLALFITATASPRSSSTT